MEEVNSFGLFAVFGLVNCKDVVNLLEILLPIYFKSCGGFLFMALRKTDKNTEKNDHE